MNLDIAQCLCVYFDHVDLLHWSQVCRDLNRVISSMPFRHFLYVNFMTKDEFNVYRFDMSPCSIYDKIKNKYNMTDDHFVKVCEPVSNQILKRITHIIMNRLCSNEQLKAMTLCKSLIFKIEGIPLRKQHLNHQLPSHLKTLKMSSHMNNMKGHLSGPGTLQCIKIYIKQCEYVSPVIYEIGDHYEWRSGETMDARRYNAIKIMFPAYLKSLTFIADHSIISIHGSCFLHLTRLSIRKINQCNLSCFPQLIHLKISTIDDHEIAKLPTYLKSLSIKYIHTCYNYIQFDHFVCLRKLFIKCTTSSVSNLPSNLCKLRIRKCRRPHTSCFAGAHILPESLISLNVPHYDGSLPVNLEILKLKSLILKGAWPENLRVLHIKTYDTYVKAWPKHLEYVYLPNYAYRFDYVSLIHLKSCILKS